MAKAEILSAERLFKHAVMVLVACKTYPSPAQIYRLLCKSKRRLGGLNGRECRWRREICDEIGFVLRGKKA